MCSIPRRHQIAKQHSTSSNTKNNAIHSSQFIGHATSREEQLEKANARRKQKRASGNSEHLEVRGSFFDLLVGKFTQLFSPKNYN